MTNPTVEEAMEALEAYGGFPDSLATIRKHIEDLEGIADARRKQTDELIQALEDLTESSQVERAAALVTIEGLQRRIEELETQLKGSSAGMPQTWSGNSWMVEGIADPSEPETPQS